MKKLALLLLLFSTCLPGFAQNDSTGIGVIIGEQLDFLGPLTFSFPMISQRPPLSSDMPLEVLIGYILADSTARTSNVSEIDEYLQRSAVDDSLLYALKYAYIMNNYDPVLYAQWAGRAPSGLYSSPPAYIREALSTALYQRMEDGKLLSLLLSSDIIAHVRVVEITTSEDVSAKWTSSANLVACEIIDPIKGQTMPSWDIIAKPADATTHEYKENVVPGSLLYFDYSNEWLRGNQETDFGPEKNLTNWVSANNEYVVFLRFVPVPGNDADSAYANNNWYTMFPTFVGLTEMGSMFPIENGVVIDPANDFGFGIGISIEDWKAALRQRIAQILNSSF